MKNDNGLPAFSAVPCPALVGGGPAFPGGQGTETGPTVGMSLRDYFAAQAMVGIIAKGMNDGGQWDSEYFKTVASMAYAYAGAMLAER